MNSTSLTCFVEDAGPPSLHDLACAWSEQSNNLFRLIESAVDMLESSPDRLIPLTILRAALDAMRESPAEYQLLQALTVH